MSVHVTVLVEQDAIGFLSIPSSSPTLLVISFQGFRDSVVNHKADVAFVNTHAKGDRCTDNLNAKQSERGFIEF